MNDAYGQYRLMERIAEGGMGEVFRARLVRGAGFEKVVAVKRMLPHISESPEFSAMFRAEARLAARFSHDNLVQVYDFGEQDGTLFLAMEYIDGLDLGALSALLKSKGLRMPLRHLLRIGMEACRGLDYLHRLKDEDGAECGLVHRDISPSNIMLSFEGQVKITDFGIAAPARAIDSDWLAGKLAYLSPEQLRGETLDRRSDLYSLGVVLYELLFGRRAFQPGLESSEICRAVLGGCMDWTSEAEALPDCLIDALRRACAGEKAARFAGALEMRRALEECAASLPEEEAPQDLGRWLSNLLPERALRAVAAPERTILSTQPITPPQSAQVEYPAEADAQRNAAPPELPSRRPKARFALATLLLLLLVPALGWLLWPRSVPLSVESEPAGAVVRLDGRRLGVTPVKKARLPQDGAKHSLELTLEGFETQRAELTASAGQPLNFYAELKRRRLTVLVETQPPGARVLLNGEFLEGASPLEIGELEVGVTHLLRLEMENSVPIEREFIIDKNSSGRQTFSFKMESLYARLLLKTEPQDAEVRIDGRRLSGSSPFEIEGVMRHRPLDISVTRGGYVPQTRQIKPGAEDLTELSFKLESFDCELLLESLSSSLRAQLEGTERNLPLGIGGLHKSARTLSLNAPDGGRLLIRAACSQIRDGRGLHTPQAALNINAKPWAALQVDGRETVTTPVSDVKLGAGRHRLKFGFGNEGLRHSLSLTLH